MVLAAESGFRAMKLTHCTLVVALASSACAQVTNQPGAGSPGAAPRAANALSVAQAFDRVCNGELSAPLEVVGSRHFVSVEVAGPKATETLRFHVDTGGNTRGLYLEPSVAERLGAKSVSDLPKSIKIGGHEIALPAGAGWYIGDADSEKFAQATRKGFSSGQIGAGFLSRFLVCIDPSKGRFGLALPGSIRIDDASHPAIPLLMQTMGDNHAKYPFLLTHIRDGQSVVGGYGMLLDTGATTSMIESGKIDYLRKADSHTALATGAAGDADMIAPTDPKNAERMLRVGRIVLTAPRAKFPDAPEIEGGPATFVERHDGTWEQMFGHVGPTNGAYGAIANDVLDGFRLLIDYDREVVWLDPTGRATDRSASLARVGVAVRFGADGCPVITGLTDTNAKATLAALHVGDVIVSVDGLDACKASHAELQAALAGPPGSAKQLKVRRGTESVDVTGVAAQLLPINP